MTAIWAETTEIADHPAVMTTVEVAVATVAVAETAGAVAIVVAIVEVVAATAAAETVAAEIAGGDARHAETRASPHLIDRQPRETSYMLVSLGDWNHD